MSRIVCVSPGASNLINCMSDEPSFKIVWEMDALSL